MAYTLQDVIDYTLQIDLVLAHYQERPVARNWLLLGNMCLERLARELTHAYLGTLAVTKTWSLTASQHAYDFTTSDGFSGFLKAATVYWNAALDDSYPVTPVDLQTEGRLIRQEIGDIEDPYCVIDGQQVRVYPDPPTTGGMLEIKHAKRYTAFTVTTASIQVDDAAFMAFCYELGSLITPDPNAIQALKGLAGQVMAALSSRAKRVSLVSVREP